MDFEEKRKRQMIRVIIAEVGMVISIVAIVIVSTLAAMGFMISSNGNIEQSGLMQLHTLPTGASVKIDGNAIFSRTNFSRTLSEGEHYLEIYRDRYDTWQKTIKVRPGVLIRLYYPRLFLQNRVAEEVEELAGAEGLEFYSPSVNRNYILYAKDNAAEWQLIDVKGDNIKTTSLDLSGVLPGMVEEPQKEKTASTIATHAYKFLGKIEEVIWSGNEESVLVRVSYDGKAEWVLVRLKDIAKSVNLTKTFGLDSAAEVRIIDNVAGQLYVLERGQLRRFNVNDSVMSRVLLENVVDFMNYDTNVIYLAQDEEKQIVGVYRDDEKAGTVLAEVSLEREVRVALSSYYGDDYMVWTVDKEINVLYGRLPSYNENGVDLSSLKRLMEGVQLGEVPENLFVSPGNEFVVAKTGVKMMVIDLEMGDLSEYEAPSGSVEWFDASMFYAIKDGEILVWDFDGTNQRNLAESVNVAEDGALPVLASKFPVMIANNNRWLYYLTSGEDALMLIREKVRE